METHFRQGKYCNNMATKVIPFFIVSKPSLGEIILITVWLQKAEKTRYASDTKCYDVISGK